MKSDDLITFIIEEAQHRVINDECTKNAKTALAAHAKKGKKKRGGKGKKPAKSEDSESDVKCGNCRKEGHTENNCWSKGGGKEGQGPRQKKKSNKPKMAIIASNDEENDLFAFTCTSDYAAVTDALQFPKSKLGNCIDSGVSQVYSPDWLKFVNYKLIDCDITTADGRTIKAIGMGDLHLDLPNGSK